NMQTSFMHPPFGFALFYLRSVAPAKQYLDKLTNKLTDPVTTGQIYWGAVPFVVIQIVMIGLVILFPQMVMVYKATESTVDPSKVQCQLPPSGSGAPSSGSQPAQPETTQQMEEDDKRGNEDAQSLEDAFKS